MCRLFWRLCRIPPRAYELVNRQKRRVLRKKTLHLNFQRRYSILNRIRGNLIRKQSGSWLTFHKVLKCSGRDVIWGKLSHATENVLFAFLFCTQHSGACFQMQAKSCGAVMLPWSCPKIDHNMSARYFSTRGYDNHFRATDVRSLNIRKYNKFHWSCEEKKKVQSRPPLTYPSPPGPLAYNVTKSPCPTYMCCPSAVLLCLCTSPMYHTTQCTKGL